MSYLFQSILGVMASFNLSQAPQKDCLPPTQIYQKIKPSEVEVLIEGKEDGHRFTGHGSGMVISDDGTIITATHVVKGTTSIKVRDSAGKVYAYHVDRKGYPMSVSSIKPDNAYPADYTALKDVTLDVGEQLYAYGFPMDYEAPGLFTAGYYMGKRYTNGMSYLMTTMLVNPGNSGGGVVDCEGNIQGFVEAIDVRAIPVFLLNPVQDAINLMQKHTGGAR